MNAEPDRYQTYLLRLWRVPRQGEWQWCASLESRQTGEHQSFAAVEQLFAFLSARCAGEEAPDEMVAATEGGMSTECTMDSRDGGGGTETCQKRKAQSSQLRGTH